MRGESLFKRKCSFNNFAPYVNRHLHSPPACGVVASCNASRLEGHRDGVQHSSQEGRLVLECLRGLHGLTAQRITVMGLGASPAASGFAPGTLQDNAMTMDTARLVLVNSTLQSTNEASTNRALTT